LRKKFFLIGEKKCKPQHHSGASRYGAANFFPAAIVNQPTFRSSYERVMMTALATKPQVTIITTTKTCGEIKKYFLSGTKNRR